MFGHALASWPLRMMLLVSRLPRPPETKMPFAGGFGIPVVSKNPVLVFGSIWPKRCHPRGPLFFHFLYFSFYQYHLGFLMVPFFDPAGNFLCGGIESLFLVSSPGLLSLREKLRRVVSSPKVVAAFWRR